MNKNYIDLWFDDINSRNGFEWKKDIESNGICHKIAGPKKLIASVLLSYKPGNKFEVHNALPPNLNKTALIEGFVDYIIFGVIDILFISPISPLKSVNVTIHSIEIDEIYSSQIAFRLAARDATKKALLTHYPNMKLDI